MIAYKFNKAMQILDHAIDHLGASKPCFPLIDDGKMYNVPTNSVDAARAVLVDAMLRLVRDH